MFAIKKLYSDEFLKGEKPHKCDTCAAAFIRKHDLTNHSRIHSGK